MLGNPKSDGRGKSSVKFLKPEEVLDEWRPHIDFSRQEMRPHGSNGRATFVLFHCMDCGSAGWKSAALMRGFHRPPLCQRCAYKRRGVRQRASGSYQWSGGIVIDDSGYRRLHLSLIPQEDMDLVFPMRTANGIYVLEHRYVAAKKYGRSLKSKEFVRHLNGIKTDNRPENLIIGTIQENQRDHDSARMAAIYWRNVAEALSQKLEETGICTSDYLTGKQLPKPT